MKILRVLLLISFFVFVSSKSMLAVSENECNQKDQKTQDAINCWNELITATQNRENSLKNEITKLNATIALTSANIQKTQKEIEKLGEEIEALSNKIDRLEGSLADLSNVLIERIVATYKQGDIEPIFLLLSSNGFSDFLTKFKYIKIVQAHDKRLMFQMQETKDNYTDQKTLREQKKQEQEVLRRQLESQKATLAQQQRDKQTLLEITKNDERRYQQLLAQALAEQGAIKRAFSNALELLKNGGGDPVSAGDTIATLGNSGAPDCSTGAHLHFSMLKDGNIQNPADYLKNVSVVWENQPDGSFSFSGDWDWPIFSPTITQGFGMTWWARRGWYGGNIHDGIDVVSRDSTTIKTPKSGRIIRGSTICDSSSIPGVSTLKYAAVAHDGGMITVYLHIQ